jgi:hypothetical protein
MRADVLLARGPDTLYALLPNPAVTHSSTSPEPTCTLVVSGTFFGAPVAACCIGFVAIGDVY